MNTPNNKRRKASQEKIEKVFVQLIQTKELSNISVTDICKKTGLNRSTFYANYLDVEDLADKIAEKLEEDVAFLYQKEREAKSSSNNFLKILNHIKENQIFYKTYFKLKKDKNNVISSFGYDTNLSKLLYNDKYIEYHIEFFKAGFNAIINKWLDNNCKETPEEIENILKEEYKNKHISV